MTTTDIIDETMTAAEMIALTKRHSIFSWSAQASVNPIAMTRGEGIYFWDADGKRYIDMNSQLMCVNIGHGDKRVIEAIKRQADELVYAGPGMASAVRARVGKMLADLTPGDLNRFFFTLGGAEANENAIRIARMVSGRQKIMVRYRSYHGATAGAISLTGDPRRWANEPGLVGVVRYPDTHRWGEKEPRPVAESLQGLEDVGGDDLLLDHPEAAPAQLAVKSREYFDGPEVGEEEMASRPEDAMDLGDERLHRWIAVGGLDVQHGVER